MVNSDPSDDDIIQADAVILVDAPRNWQLFVGSTRLSHRRSLAGRSMHDMGYTLRIPVDSRDPAAVRAWHDRVRKLIRAD